MSTRLTISLPDEIYNRVQELAQLFNREISEVLSDRIQLFNNKIAIAVRGAWISAGWHPPEEN